MRLDAALTARHAYSSTTLPLAQSTTYDLQRSYDDNNNNNDNNMSSKNSMSPVGLASGYGMHEQNGSGTTVPVLCIYRCWRLTLESRADAT